MIDYYTPDEVAQALRISTYSVYEAVKRGEMGCSRLGKSGRLIRISDEDIELFLHHTDTGLRPQKKRGRPKKQEE